MKCIICKSKTKKGTKNVVFTKGNSTILIKDVPGLVCENCGEAYVVDNVAEKLLEICESEFKKRLEIEILRYAA